MPPKKGSKSKPQTKKGTDDLTVSRRMVPENDRRIPKPKRPDDGEFVSPDDALAAASDSGGSEARLREHNRQLQARLDDMKRAMKAAQRDEARNVPVAKRRKEATAATDDGTSSDSVHGFAPTVTAIPVQQKSTAASLDTMTTSQLVQELRKRGEGGLISDVQASAATSSSVFTDSREFFSQTSSNDSCMWQTPDRAAQSPASHEVETLKNKMLSTRLRDNAVKKLVELYKPKAFADRLTMNTTAFGNSNATDAIKQWIENAEGDNARKAKLIVRDWQRADELQVAHSEDYLLSLLRIVVNKIKIIFTQQKRKTGDRMYETAYYERCDDVVFATILDKITNNQTRCLTDNDMLVSTALHPLRSYLEGALASVFGATSGSAVKGRPRQELLRGFVVWFNKTYPPKKPHREGHEVNN